MTHDFARQRAAKTNRERKGSSPAWLWFTSGLVLGVLLSFLVYLATLAPGPTRPAVPPVANATPQQKAAPGAPQSKPKFTYYTELPQITTERPAQNPADAGQEPPSAAPAPAKPAPATAATAETSAPAATRIPAEKTPDTAASEPIPPVEVAEPVALTLQAGAFRDAADASRRRADITLLGYPARVETVAGAASSARYRVQVGPFEDAASLADARNALADQGIEVR